MFTITPRALVAPTAALIAGSALAVSSAAGQDDRTLKLEGSSAGEVRNFDLRPKGISPGDHWLASGTLRQNGRVFGRGHSACTVVDKAYEGLDCQFVLVLRDGTLTAAGGGLNRRLPGQPPDPDDRTDEFAVTGGTGAYDGASGTMSVTTRRDDSGSIVITY